MKRAVMIPEPATWVLAAVVTALLCIRRRPSQMVPLTFQRTERLAIAVAVLAVIVLPSGASSALMVFTDEAAFLAAANVVSTETFDELPSGTNLGDPVAIVDGITYTANDPEIIGPPPPPGVIGWFASNSTVATSPPKVFSYNGFRQTTSLSLGEGANAIGFFLTTGVRVPPPEYKLTVLLGDDTQMLVNASGTRIFRGFTASDRIKSITIDTRSDSGSFNFELDNVSRSPIIPEPATWLLFTISSVFLLHTRCRRSDEHAPA